MSNSLTVQQSNEMSKQPKTRNRKKPTRKNLDETQRKALKIAISDTPRNYGYNSEIWTVSLIMDYIEHAFSASCIKPQVCHILRSLGLPVRRAKTIYVKQNKMKRLAKPGIDEKRTEILKAAIANSPREHGYEADNWTIALLIDYLKREFGMSCGKTRANRLLREIGVSVRRKRGVFIEPEGKEVISRENLDENQRSILKMTLAADPKNYGYDANDWNITMVVDYIERAFGRTYIKPQVCHLLRSMGLSVRREPNEKNQDGKNQESGRFQLKIKN